MYVELKDCVIGEEYLDVEPISPEDTFPVRAVYEGVETIKGKQLHCFKLVSGDGAECWYGLSKKGYMCLTEAASVWKEE